MRAVVFLIIASSIASGFACAAPAPPPPANGSGTPCGLTPQELAAPTVSNANYVPPPASASASASSQ